MNLEENLKKSILDKWIDRIRKEYPDMQDNSKIELLDHMPQFIDKLFKALKSKTSEEIGINNVSKVHGSQRSEIKEYSIEKIIKEYSILRFTIIEVLSDLNKEEQKIVHENIDEAQLVSVMQFSKEREIIAGHLTSDLMRSNKDLERFAAIAAHDLKSPLSTIIGYIDIIQDELIKNPSDSLKKSLGYMQSSAGRMLLLIERLLAYARLGHTESNNQNVDLKNVVSEVMISLNDPSLDFNIIVESVDLPTIKADPSLIHQLFQNLIGNSIKFRSKKLPIIKVELENEDENFWTICVKDNGIGFDSKNAEQVFEPFKRLNNTNEYQGSGLGLATVKRIVELLGGEIWVESKVGDGCKFSFTISKAFKL